MNKLTVAAGIAALCVLGVTGTAGSRYLAGGPSQLDAAGPAAARTALMSVTVGATTTFTGGTSIISANGDYQLLMKTNGDLVENSLHGIAPIGVDYMGGTATYDGGGNAAAPKGTPDAVEGTYVGEDTTQVWQSGTEGRSGARAVVQGDGNFVIYAASNAVLWASNTAGHPGATLTVQNDGNVVLYDNGRALWATHTVSIVSGSSSGSSTVNFRVCPGDSGSGCAHSAQVLPNGTGVTMLCWEDEPQETGWPSDRWFYADLGSSPQNLLPSLGWLNASVVEGQTQIKTPHCTDTMGESPLPPAPATPKAVPPVTSDGGGGSGTYTETVGGPTHTWTDYSDAGGTEGATISTGQSVQVTCVVQGFKVSDGNTNWYQIASSPWSNAYYASADAFYNNGATSGSLRGTPFVDPNVPAC